MNKRNIFAVGLFVSLAIAQSGMAQKYPNTPPEVSPMPMKPEMTEIWNPEVKVITPGEKLGDAPSDAIILFDGKNLNQWVSKKDPSKPAAWKIKLHKIISRPTLLMWPPMAN